ncbi:MAG TPA: HAD-IA family hydrolase [Nitrososphaerales archaeon]|nr:HAD-IA family hydrolase [Nitrososphaerales archaeon]
MKSEAKYSAFVFDFDGTLFDLPVDWKAVRRDLYALTGVRMEEVSIFTVIEKLTSTDAPLRARLFVAIDAHESPAAERATPIAGALDLISRLAAESRVALITMQGKAACTRVLDRYEITDSFRLILTREDSLERSEQLRAAFRALGTRPSQGLFVGDKMSDLAAGKEVGAEVALVGARAKKEWKPDHLFPKLAELLAFLG